MKRVLVVWEDASEADDGPWVTRSEAKKAEPVIFHQVGYLYSITPDELELTQCVGVEFMSPRSRIPAGMVRSLTELLDGEPIKMPKKRTKAAR